MTIPPHPQEKSAPPPSPADTAPGPGAILAGLWRGRAEIAAAALLALLCAAVWLWGLATPLYRSTAVVMLDPREERVAGLDSVIGGLPGDTPVVNTEVEVLRGRGLIGRVAERLALAEDPEFNAELRPKGPVARFLASLRPAAPPGDAARRDAVIDALLDRVTVRNVPQSLVFRITAETADPTKSARIADAVAELYILDQLRVKVEATRQATDWLTERVAALQAELEAAEAKVQAFRAGTPLVDAGALAALDRRMKEMRDRIAAAEAEAAGGGAAAQAASDRAAALRAAGAELEAQLRRQSDDLIALEQLTREAASSRLLYEHFLTRLKETSVQQGIQQADSRILSQAVVARAPSSPRKGLVLAVAGLAGLMAGGGLALAWGARTDRFRTARDLEVLGRPALGEIPRIPGRGRRAALAHLAARPGSAEAEAVRGLRLSLEAAGAPRVVAVTSALPGEGKTLLALALAQSLTAAGRRVALVEGDLPRRSWAAEFGVAPGLGAALAGRAPVEEALRPVPGLGEVLAAEALAGGADLFAAEGFARLIGALRGRCDMVLIDTPPLLAVPDARVIARRADAVLFAVKWDATRRVQVEEALRLLGAGAVTGFALTQVSPRGMRRYGLAERHGAYARYGRDYYAG